MSICDLLQRGMGKDFFPGENEVWIYDLRSAHFGLLFAILKPDGP